MQTGGKTWAHTLFIPAKPNNNLPKARLRAPVTVSGKATPNLSRAGHATRTDAPLLPSSATLLRPFSDLHGRSPSSRLSASAILARPPADTIRPVAPTVPDPYHKNQFCCPPGPTGPGKKKAAILSLIIVLPPCLYFQMIPDRRSGSGAHCSAPAAH